MQRVSWLGILIILVGVFSSGISAQMSVKLDPFLSGLSSPLFLTNAKDRTNRIFVVQQGGIIKVVQPGSTTPTNFIDISGKIFGGGGERGLLGLAFHPQFATNGYFFVNYTRAGDGATIIARYKTTDNTNALGDPNSERILLTVPQPFSNHNGGMIEFGPDSNLYIGMGDGGSGNDPNNNAQNTGTLLGEFLRIAPDVSGNNNNPAYAIPTDNPFTGANTARCSNGSATNGKSCREIYAVGMRNPFRWSFDRGGTNQLYAGDVGQTEREEVDIITNGGNYGWRILEGTICTPGVNPNCTAPTGNIFPIYEYTHDGGRCSITGGYVYRGTQATVPNGAYIYGDYCTGEIFQSNNNQQTVLLDTERKISSFGEDEAGEIYVVGLGGTVEKLSPLGTTAASVTITGRALTSSGRGIGNVIIRLTDSSGNVRMARTSAFGYYRFNEVAAGETYVISAARRRFIFSQPSQVLNVNADLSAIDFIADF